MFLTSSSVFRYLCSERPKKSSSPFSMPANTSCEAQVSKGREQEMKETKGLRKMTKSACMWLGLVLALASAGAAA